MRNKKIRSKSAKQKENRILICPRCGSTKIIPHHKNHMIHHGEIEEAFYSVRICEKCHYTGYFFPEVPVSKLKQIQKEIKKLKNEKRSSR